MKLIIAEKEQLGRLIADAIDGPERKSGACIYKSDYCITWASGHLLTLKEPKDYDPALAKWSLNSLPLYFPNWDVKPKDNDWSRKRLDFICSLIPKADCVIHAGDPDEEGQLLIDEILRWSGCKKPVYRLATGDTTSAALKKALKNLRPNAEFENGGWSAYARTVADMTFGINMSRYFTIKNPPVMLSVGRVQTPTLGLVVARDLAIEGHTKTVYYAVKATMEIDGKTVECKYEPEKNDPNLVDGRILNEDYAKSIADKLANASFDSVQVTKKKENENPPLPVDLVELQTYCGRRYGYKPGEVLDITQTLRDKYDCITYNRSKCRYLSDNHFDEAPETMATVIRNIHAKPKGMDMTIRSKAFNSEKVNKASHFAIIPQNKEVDVSQMTERERNVYYAVVQYYMAQFMPPAKKCITKLTVPVQGGGRLVSSSTEILEEGYRILFAKTIGKDTAKNEPVTALSSIEAGTYPGTILDVGYDRKETRPPARYTQTSLNKDMTAISKYVDDPEIKKLLLEKDKDDDAENGSIGTPATRATIITTLIQRGFLAEQDKHLISTPLGRELIRILPDEAKKPDLTALWWAMQEDIRDGSSDYTRLTENVLEMVKVFLHTDYPAIDQSAVPESMKRKTGAAQKESLGICPRCGKPVIEGKAGYGCSGWREGCKFVIWKKSKLPVFAKTNFTVNDAKNFLAGKRVLKKNLIAKDGSKFEAELFLKDDPSIPYGPTFVFVKHPGKG